VYNPQSCYEARSCPRKTLRDVVLLLVEEVGELAKAVRKETGAEKSGAGDTMVTKVCGHELG